MAIQLTIKTGFSIDSNQLKSQIQQLQNNTKLNIQTNIDTSQLGNLNSTLRQQTQLHQNNGRVIRDNTAKLQEQLTIFQRMANVRLDSIDKRYGNISGMSEKISRLRQEFSGLRVENGQLVDSTGKVVSSLADCRSRLSELGGVARNSTGIFSNLKDNISKFLQFYVGAGGVLKAIEGIKSAISYTNEMNAAMTNVRIITGQSAEQVENLTQKYIDLGKQLGMTSQDVSKVAEDYYRQGKSVSETNELIKTTGQMATLSGMQMEQATQGMTAILNGYKMNVSEASHVVDTLVSIDNNGATRCYLKRVA